MEVSPGENFIRLQSRRLLTLQIYWLLIRKLRIRINLKTNPLSIKTLRCVSGRCFSYIVYVQLKIGYCVLTLITVISGMVLTTLVLHEPSRTTYCNEGGYDGLRFDQRSLINTDEKLLTKKCMKWQFIYLFIYITYYLYIIHTYYNM